MVTAGWGDLDRGLFSISVAAELAGLHPQTLRIYEREGLLDPARSAGGTRRYSRRDIDRLQEICTLTADGLNLAGIRRVLLLQEETRQLQAELARLKELAGGAATATHDEQVDGAVEAAEQRTGQDRDPSARATDAPR
jgi:MerR family transcriptional regulator, heat shock protein HspR